MCSGPIYPLQCSEVQNNILGIVTKINLPVLYMLKSLPVIFDDHFVIKTIAIYRFNDKTFTQQRRYHEILVSTVDVNPCPTEQFFLLFFKKTVDPD